MDLDILLPYNYKEYEWEIPAVKAFREGKEIWLVLHRRGGKDALSFSRFLLPTAFKKPGSYQYIFPTLKQGRDTFWEGKDEDGRDILDYYIPKEMIIKPDNADMKLTLRAIGGTSTIQIFGTNSGQYETLRGKPSNGVVLSEEAYQDPRALDVLKPMLLKTGGFLVHNSTPNGNNHFKAGYYYAKNNPDCFCLFKTIRDTFDHQGNPLITEADIQKERERGKTEDYIQQEYYCSFMQGVEGTYLGKQLQIAINEGRIGSFLYNETLPVYTAWDLGIGDFMAIIFYQLIGNKVIIIDYHEATGFSFVYYAKMIKEKGYLYENHYAPFDIKNREYGAGSKKEVRALSRLEKAEEVGITFEEVPGASFENSIDNARAIMSRCYFNNENKDVRKLITHLEQWGRTWNEQIQDYTDWEARSVHKHAGAAFRYMSTVVREETHTADYDESYDSDYIEKCSPYVGL
jgi:hypothetical protein